LSWVYWLKGMRPGDEKQTSTPLDPVDPLQSPFDPVKE
jgi:hypothetical protein